MVSSKGAAGAINGFIKEHQGEREQGKRHAQQDMCGISPVICSIEGVASIYFFPNQIMIFLNWSLAIKMKGHVAVMERKE